MRRPVPPSVAVASVSSPTLVATKSSDASGALPFRNASFGAAVNCSCVSLVADASCDEVLRCFRCSTGPPLSLPQSVTSTFLAALLLKQLPVAPRQSILRLSFGCVLVR
ncbi:hypothetical protein MTO96_037560 [Rhipicephalus appendiculatus]